ncbi:hypothetical protein H5407_22690 [Mitsuaria sp. WAJ17]|uniref:hypothetical protein n=1 Tax=Mitsuaria sp. WAJ17 TaxID=2761452 RepID=UPI0015FEC244|nr:hypothetical protein [Mitsuaria sp. WAJ17]MBB2488054.1 hypothetical protein [Mitsuaria sp. WAJ17]
MSSLTADFAIPPAPQHPRAASRTGWQRLGARVVRALGAGLWMAAVAVQAQETVCAKVKIEIKQELTLERQAFDAEMRIINSTDSSVLENVGVVVKVTDEAGTPVLVSDNPNDLNAKFFIRLSAKKDIGAADGTGMVRPRSTAVLNWLLIPAPGAAGNAPLGKKYLVGATLSYRYNGEDTVLDVAPDVIKVKPLPQLSLDYFLPAEVEGDDPLTPEVEPVQPFTLGLRVKNNGVATAKNLVIDSAQPKIIENKQDLLIGFKLTGSYVGDVPAPNTLLAKLGDVPGNSAKTARWIMESTLSGRFTEFTAKFSHADELGGAMTSLLQGTQAHTLVRDVRVDLPGRDTVRDFLAQDGDVMRVYESEGQDTVVTNHSAVATLGAGSGGSGYALNFPVTAGFVYARLPDPNAGVRALGVIQRSDGKVLAPENVWLSRTRNTETKKWEYWLNVFDVNSTGVYSTEFKAPPVEIQPPALQFIADRTVQEGQQVSFLVEASGKNGKPVTLTATPLPTGAKWLPQAADPGAPALARSVFDWTPARGSKGDYLINYTANDGLMSTSRSAKITVKAAPLLKLPALPRVVSPLAGARQALSWTGTEFQANPLPLTAALAGGEFDSATSLVFELYDDAEYSQLLASATVAPVSVGGAMQATWSVAADFRLNRKYWWRVRATDGTLSSPWVEAWFFTNQGNATPPRVVKLSDSAQYTVAQPLLSWRHTVDGDGDAVRYEAQLCRKQASGEVVPADNGACGSNSAGTGDVLIARSGWMPGGNDGVSSWQVPLPLVKGVVYRWLVLAMDARGARSTTAIPVYTMDGNRQVFTVDPAATTPVRVLQGPADKAVVSGTSVTLAVQTNLASERLDLDTVDSFDSMDRRGSALISAVNGVVSWSLTDLRPGQTYWWRVNQTKVGGRAEVRSFRMSGPNQAPSVPTLRNPAQGAWVTSTHPVLLAGLSKDPEGQAVQYEFELFADAALSTRLAGALQASPSWQVPVDLADGVEAWWRVRAVDNEGLASAWSSVGRFSMRWSQQQAVALALAYPDRPMMPVVDGSTKVQPIRWEVSAIDADVQVALYYKKVTPGSAAPEDSRTVFNGQLIADGIKPAPGQRSGEWMWDVSALPTGTYYVYALATSAQGQGQVFAPGALVIPSTNQRAQLTMTRPTPIYESTRVSLPVSYNGMGTAPVSLDVTSGELTLVEGSRVLTTGNAGNASVEVSYGRQCMSTYVKDFLTVGSLVSEDPDLMGRQLVGSLTGLVHLSKNNVGSGNPESYIRLCNIRVLSETKVSATSSDYVISADLGNLYRLVHAVTAKPQVGAPIGGAQCPTIEASSGELKFGFSEAGQVVKTASTVTVRAKSGLSRASMAFCGPAWILTVTETP